MCSEVEHKHSTNTPYIFFNHKFHFIFLNVIKASCYILFCSRLLFPFYTNYGHGHILLCVCVFSISLYKYGEGRSERAFIIFLCSVSFTHLLSDSLRCMNVILQSFRDNKWYFSLRLRPIYYCYVSKGNDKLWTRQTLSFLCFLLSIIIIIQPRIYQKIGNKIFYNIL